MKNSIGSRRRHGVVEVFDSYKFKSISYYNVKHHYRSLNTWLKGVCTSICPEHKWKRSKKPIVYTREQYLNKCKLKERTKFLQSVNFPSLRCKKSHEFYICQKYENDKISQMLTSLKLVSNTDSEVDDWNENIRFSLVPTSKDIDYAKFIEGYHIFSHIPSWLNPTNPKSLIKIIENMKMSMDCDLIDPIEDINKYFLESYRLDSIWRLWRFLNCKNKGNWLLIDTNNHCPNKAYTSKNGVEYITDIMKFKMKLLRINTGFDNIIDTNLEKLDEEDKESEDESRSTSSQDSDNNISNPDEEEDETWSDSGEKEIDDKEIDPVPPPEPKLTNVAGRTNVNFPYMNKYNVSKLKHMIHRLKNKIIMKTVSTYEGKSRFKRAHSMPIGGAIEDEKDSLDFFYENTLDVPVAIVCTKPYICLTNLENCEDYMFSINAYSKIGFDFMDNLKSSLKNLIKSMLKEIKYWQSPFFGCFKLLTFQFILDKKLQPVLVKLSDTLSLYTKTWKMSILKTESKSDHLIKQAFRIILRLHHIGAPSARPSDIERFFKLLSDDVDNSTGYELLYTDYKKPKGDKKL